MINQESGTDNVLVLIKNSTNPERAKVKDNIDLFLSFTGRAHPFSEKLKIEGFDPTMVLTYFRAWENCVKFNFNWNFKPDSNYSKNSSHLIINLNYFIQYIKSKLHYHRSFQFLLYSTCSFNVKHFFESSTYFIYFPILKAWETERELRTCTGGTYDADSHHETLY